MDIIKVGILGVAAVLMAIPLRKEKQEYSMFLSMAVCICIFIYIITKVQIVLEFVEKLEGMIAIDSAYIGDQNGGHYLRSRICSKCVQRLRLWCDCRAD